MTKEEAKEYAEFLNAFAEGKEVQHAFKDRWVSFDEQDINNIFDYLLSFIRIKPEYEAYNCMLNFVMHLQGAGNEKARLVDSEGEKYKILTVTFQGVTLQRIEPCSVHSYTWQELVRKFTWEPTGEPCGEQV